jgi:predicted alpha/beta-fold hydrolase
MIHHDVKAPIQRTARATAVAMLCAALSIGQSIAAQANDQKAGETTERIVQVQSKDEVADFGAIFTPPKNVAKPIAVIWIHGAGVNFYSPTYLAISRDLAKRGYTVITGNTRTHDLDQSLKGSFGIGISKNRRVF